MSTRAGRPLAAVAAIAGLALTAGCGLMGGDDDAGKSEEDRLVEMMNETRRIDSELMAAELRIVQNCLEEKGHTVHDAWSMETYTEPETDSLTSYYPHEAFLIDTEEATEYGFGQWANSPDGMESGEAEEYYAEQEKKWQEEEGGDEWEEPDNSAFEALTPEEQYAWYVAYQGEEYVEQSYGTEAEFVSSSEAEEELVEEDLSEEELAALEEEAAAEEEGEISLDEEEEWVDPKPGGCQLEMIQALYGEPELVEETYEEEGESGSYSYWSYRPANPAYDEETTIWEDIDADYAAAVADLQYEFTDCLTALGHEGWEFTEYNSLPIWEFFTELYYQNSSEEERAMWGGESDVELPPIPDAAGDSYEEWKAYEIQLALDFGKCGEETGYAEASKKAYEDAHVKAYSAIEDDVFAWQDEMSDVLSKAQDLLK